MQVRFILPTSVVAADFERFHVSGAKVCPPGPVATAKPGPALEQAESFKLVTSDAHAFDVDVIFRGRQCRVQVTGWYDTDGNAVVNAGDLIGEGVAVDARDRGIFAGNLTRGADVALTPIVAP